MAIDAQLHGHEKQGVLVLRRVWYEGTDAIARGEAVCYNSDYGTATDADARRANRVERASASNSRDFAGVTARDYSAKSTGQFIDIYAPGSKSVPVALAIDTTIGDLLVFTSASGRFYSGKYRGRGAAIARQTKTAVIESDFTGANWSLSADGLTLTVADTTGLAAGDTVLLVGGEDDGTGKVVAGKYIISSVDNATTLTLKTSAVDTTAAGALSASGAAYSGNPVAICDLLEGDESGGAEFLSPPNVGGVVTASASGITYVLGGVTLAADADVALAQASEIGQKKSFELLGALTTSDFTVDLVVVGLTLAGIALNEINALDAAADAATLEFNGAKWRTLDIAGGATEA